MRNQRALGAACAAVALLGLAAPVALADGTGNGGVPANNTGILAGDVPGGFTATSDGTVQLGASGIGAVGDGSLRNIVAAPGVIAAGSQLTVAVNGCRAGTMSSGVFSAVPLRPLRDDTARGVVLIDRAARPGRYDLTVRCDGRTLTRPAAFAVLGGVRGGVGGSKASGASTADLAVGGALVAASVIGGGVYVLCRRKARRS